VKGSRLATTCAGLRTNFLTGTATACYSFDAATDDRVAPSMPPEVNGMTRRRLAAFALITLISTPAVAPAQGRFVTENFVISAPTDKLAKTFGEYAEFYRKQKAIDWLGAELKPWQEKCPIKVAVEPNRTGGATTFSFSEQSGESWVASRKMEIFGNVDSLLNSVLPHEVTHTVFADHFGRAVPRWADEGGSVFSENDEERYQHDVKCRQMLNQGGVAFPLRALFSMNKYPPDMHTLYAQGYSVVNFLITKGGRQHFLEFVGVGMRNGNNNWQAAARQVYGFESVDDLQAEWLQTLKASRPTRVATGLQQPGTAPATAVAEPRGATSAAFASNARGPQTRTSPGGLPLLEAPVVARGVPPVGEPNRAGPTPPPVLPTPVRLGAPELPPRRPTN
jgi:hypothetical protein